MKSGTIFDNVLITDDVEYAETFGADTWGKTKDAEKEMKKKVCGIFIGGNKPNWKPLYYF